MVLRVGFSRGRLRGMKTIKIACKAHAEANLDDLIEFQGDLKILPAAEYEALKAQILDNGFSFAPHVWEDKGVSYLLDGHQRCRTLKKLREEGWTVPPIPYSLVYAGSFKEAKIKLLAGASQYGKVTNDGLLSFLQEIEITPELLKTFPLPGINMLKFIEVNLADIDVSAHTRAAIGSKEIDEKSFDKFDHECPRCKFAFNEPK
jgi:hypothetical protein